MILLSHKELWKKIPNVSQGYVQALIGATAHAHQELKTVSPSRFDDLVNIGIDETSYKNGHKYMTIVINTTRLS